MAVTRWVRTLVFANVLVFFVTLNAPAAAEQLALIPALLLSRPWTVFTYMFLHANISHIFWNMLGLFFFGSRLELRLGDRNFLMLYFISGLVGALASVIFTPEAAVIGASGAVNGVMLGYARYWPRDTVLIWGILPVPAGVLVVGMTVFSLFAGFGNAGGGIAHFAHLGGFLGAYIYLNIMERSSPAARFKARAAALERAGVTDIMRWRNITPAGLHPINREELERLKKKMEEIGPSRLTPDEKAFLNRLAAEQKPV